VTTSDGVRIAYCTHGSGPPLVFVRGWISHLEAFWEKDTTRAFFEALGERFTVVRFDSRGQGLSERVVEHIDLDALTNDLETVVDVLELEDVVLYGQTFGGPIAINYAARHPYRISRLILDGTYAKPLMPYEQARESFLRTLEEMWPDSLSLVAQLTSPGKDAAVDVRSDWAVSAITGTMAARLYRLGVTVDVSHLLAHLAIPTLVMHRRRSRSVPFRHARDLVAELPNPTFVPLDGTHHNPWEGDAQAALDAIGRFLGVDLPLPSRPVEPSAPVAILFTDMEASTAMTSRLGDVRAQELVRTHDAVVRAAIGSADGLEVKHTGDGIMASFVSISAAVTAAVEIQRGLRRVEAPFRVKIGIDVGEPLRDGNDLTGTVVQSARRIVDRAEPGQILVSDVVRRLVAGKEFTFVDRGRVTLRGLPERVRLYAVSSDERDSG
jgi:pimeloyl-ACP methyl ester carboxylesterase